VLVVTRPTKDCLHSPKFSGGDGEGEYGQQEENKIKISRKMALLTCVKNDEWLFIISASTWLEL